jgi:hypothetical protein
MCHECDDEYDDQDQGLPNFQEAPQEYKESFYDYVVEQMGLVIDKAESTGVLYQLITEWPKERIVQFELAVVMQGNTLDDDNWKEE